MEIHSSSLAFIPARYNNDKSNNESESTKNNDVKPVAQPIDKKVIDARAEDVKRLTNTISLQEEPLKKPQESREIDAYIKEKTQPLREKRADLNPGINFFI